MVPLWLRSFVKWVNAGQPARRRRGQAARPRQAFRPTLEQFEQRLVPTTVSIPTNLVVGRNSIISVPINVNTLNDPANGNEGLSAGDFAVFYDQAEFTLSASDVVLGTLATNGSTANGNGYSPTNVNGWSLTVNANNPGQLGIGLSNSATGLITNSASGSLVIINFHVKSSAPAEATKIDLAADTFGGVPETDLTDDSISNNYILNPAPVDNVTNLNPYTYTGSDPDDGAVTITGVNLPPVANNDTYSVTERALASDPGLTVASPGVLANDTDPQGSPLTASLLTQPAHGQLTFNSDGSFVYNPSLGYLGADSFTYQANDGLSNSSPATVFLTVTSRLSIPTNLSGSVGGTVVVPVNMDNPDGDGMGGVTGASLAIDYDPTVFTVTNADISTGTLTSNTNTVETITFGGTVTGGQFTLSFNNTGSGGSINGSTNPINYSTASATLQSSIQSALDGLMGAGNTLVSASSATSVTVTFQNSLGDTSQPAMTTSSSLTGTNPTVSAAVTTEGFAAWSLTPNVGTGPNAGEIGIALSSSVPNSNTSPGSLVLITFQINPSAAQGDTPINLAATNTPGGTITVTTRLSSLTGQFPLRPVPTNASNDVGVDGIVDVVGPHFAVTVPTTATAGTAFSFTVTAENAGGSTNTSYTGTVHFTSSDSQAVLPNNATLTNGTGTFLATLRTAGVQTLTATDTVNSGLTDTSSPITVSPGTATHFVVAAPATAEAGHPVNVTVTAEDPFGNTATGYAGLVHFLSSDAQAVLPANSTLTSGTGSFAVTFETTGNQNVTATDTVTSTITGSAAVSVTPDAATHFAVSAPAAATAGTAFSFTVKALDTFNNLVTSYSGTVDFSSSDGSALLPANTTLTAGTGTFAATLNTDGAQTLSATDSQASSITGSAVVNVSGVATHFLVTAPAAATAGTPTTVTVTALDSSNNTAANYTGTVHFTSTDGAAALPANATLTNGTGTFSVTFKTAASQVITATDVTTASITGSAAVSVGAAQATHFAVSAPPTRNGRDQLRLHGDGPGFVQQHGDRLHGHRAVP